MELVCPTCGTDMVPILWGLPMRTSNTESIFDKADRGEVILGGCDIPHQNPPRIGCPKCFNKKDQ